MPNFLRCHWSIAAAFFANKTAFVFVGMSADAMNNHKHGHQAGQSPSTAAYTTNSSSTNSTSSSSNDRTVKSVVRTCCKLIGYQMLVLQ